MSRFLLVTALCGALGLAAGPLLAAEKVQVQTHRSETPADAKVKRTQTTEKVVGVSFEARARIAANGTIQYDCLENHGGDGRQSKPHFHEEQ